MLPPVQQAYRREYFFIPKNQLLIFSALRDLKVLLESLNVLGKGVPALAGDSAESAGLFSLESLLHLDVSRSGKLVELHAQVSGRGSGLGLDVHEVRLHHANQYAHHRKPQLRMEQRIQRLERYLFLFHNTLFYSVILVLLCFVLKDHSRNQKSQDAEHNEYQKLGRTVADQSHNYRYCSSHNKAGNN